MWLVSKVQWNSVTKSTVCPLPFDQITEKPFVNPPISELKNWKQCRREISLSCWPRRTDPEWVWRAGRCERRYSYFSLRNFCFWQSEGRRERRETTYVLRTGGPRAAGRSCASWAPSRPPARGEAGSGHWTVHGHPCVHSDGRRHPESRQSLRRRIDDAGTWFTDLPNPDAQFVDNLV